MVKGNEITPKRKRATKKEMEERRSTSLKTVAQPKEEKEEESRLKPRYADIYTSYWNKCPIKSHLDGHNQLVEVLFDDECPSKIRCLLIPSLEEVSRPLPSHADLPESWSIEDAQSHNKAIIRTTQAVITLPIPTTRLGTVCSRCTRGRTTGLEFEQEKSTIKNQAELTTRKLPRRSKGRKNVK